MSCVCSLRMPCVYTLHKIRIAKCFSNLRRSDNNHKLVTCVVGKAMPSTLFFPHINEREYNHELSRKKNITKSIVSQ